MIRADKTYSVEEILPQIIFSDVNPRKKIKQDFDGDRIKMNSLRLNVFKEKGIKCVCCGLEGRFFAKEKSIENESYHFNLYAINENGNEVLMTKDHIMARSKGGPDHLDNMQTMCIKCNNEKDTMSIEEFEEYKKNKVKLKEVI